MAAFTKTYNVQPNNAQRAAMTRHFKDMVTYLVTVEKKDVSVVTKAFNGTTIVANMIVNLDVIESIIIGPRGGVTIAC